MEEQIEYLLVYAKVNNDPAAALKVIELEALLLERDTKIKKEFVKQETVTDLPSQLIETKYNLVGEKFGSFLKRENLLYHQLVCKFLEILF